MKRAIIIFLLLLAAGSAKAGLLSEYWGRSTAVSGWTPISGLVAHWKMNDNAASTVVVDSKGTNNGTAFQNTLAMATNGVIGGALFFNGSSDGINCNDVITGTVARTFALWVNRISGTYVGCFGSGVEATSHMFSIDIWGGGEVYFAGSSHDLDGSQSLTPGTWYHVAVVYSNPGMTIYVNGGIDAQDTGFTGLDTSANGIGIGWNRPDNNQGFSALLDDVRIYNRALTADEILRLAARTELE